MARIHWCLVILLGVCAAPVGAQQIENPANGHLYQVLPSADWETQKQAAIDLGGFLVTINDAAENDWLVDNFFVSVFSDIWIGLTDEVEEGNFVWLSGEPVDYTNWNANEPNDWENGDPGEDLTELQASGGWNDVQTLNNQQRALVEIVPAFQFTQQTSGRTFVEEGDAIVISVTAVSPESDIVTYQWFKDGVAIDGETNSTYTVSSATFDDGGVYYAEASDGIETLQSDSLTLTVFPEGSLPVGGLLGLMALGAAVTAGGAVALRRKR